MNLDELVKKLADKSSKKAEANIQADIRQLLIQAPLDLEEEDLADITLESQVGNRRRIDIELGATVIEVKKDLRKGNVLSDAILQLSGYVEAKTQETGQNYVGILTDGSEWLCFHLHPSRGFIQVSEHIVSSRTPDTQKLCIWLDGVLATKQGTIPTPQEIFARLGSESSSYEIHRANLAGLYEKHKELPTVQMKRALWAKLLTTAFGSHFDNDDELFVEHTLLVNSAEIIAHSVLGLNVNTLSSATLLSGAQFEQSGIYGVVENDFFDWVLEISEGDIFVRSLARKIGRFDWSDVTYDIMKVLYESIINPEIRKQLGEYYTPDWLAYAVVQKTVKGKLGKRILDPSCGSGTFLFHATRAMLEEAEAQNYSVKRAIETATNNIIGFDIHPVAVTLARVTYLLAIGRERLTNNTRGVINIPVYLGDSMQWQQKPVDLFSANHIVIDTSDGSDLFGSELRFPNDLLEDSRVFDELVKSLAEKALTKRPGQKPPPLNAVFKRLDIPEEHQKTIKITFSVMCDLHESGRDHIWGYYVRNLVRPAWMSLEKNKVDFLIGNPPWLSYRFMPEDMQASFKEISQEYAIWQGAKVATHQDLSALFVARTIRNYLKDDGEFAFVMPNSVVDRDYYSGFRKGNYHGKAGVTNVVYDQPWDLRRIRPHIFPRGSCVVFGKKSTGRFSSMPNQAEYWSGQLPDKNGKWHDIEGLIKRDVEEIALGNETSPYAPKFQQGATLVPRVLVFVKNKPLGPLGSVSGRSSLKSSRSPYEKKPWKEVESLEGTIETEFVRPVYSGSAILPFRKLDPELSVIPWHQNHLIGTQHESLELFPGLCDWWRCSENIWMKLRSSNRLNLLERLDFQKGLSQQFPIQPERVVYATAGMHVCAARLFDKRAIVDSNLYWASVRNPEEGLYLCAVLNSKIITAKTRPLMSYGKDERHIHKHVWKLPIPKFKSSSKLHMKIAGVGASLEKRIGDLNLRKVHFTALRRDVREFIGSSEEGLLLEELIEKLIDN
jgi:hypothetical protein